MAWTLTAMDPTTNRIVWQKQMTYPMGGGSGLLSTAGGDAVHRSQRGDYLWVFKLGGRCLRRRLRENRLWLSPRGVRAAVTKRGGQP